MSVGISARTSLKASRCAAKGSALAAKILALPTKRYGVIVADQPWRFEPYSRVTGMDRAADNQGLGAIKALDVPSIAAKDCVLFLWTTAPMLCQAFEVIKAWGFAYKSNLVWVKDKRQAIGHADSMNICRRPKKRGPFQFVPVMARAMVERLA
jgi:N6-adenosine-specific RNA methylase IME4